MIITAVITAVLTAITAVVGLFPSGTVTAPGPHNGSSFQPIGFIVGFVPITAMVGALAALLAWSAVLVGIRFTSWVLTLAHVTGGEG